MNSFYDFATSVCNGTFSPEGSFDSQVSLALPAEVRMFSGCTDDQTSSDVKCTSKFGLKPALGPSGAGGACTNSLLLSLQEKPEQSWSELLFNMRKILKKKKYKQIPQLSASQNMDLNTPFTLHNPKEKELGGKKRALLIGINYTGQPIKLKGCINDIRKIEKWLKTEGFDNIKKLSDEDELPTLTNIISGIMWLVEGASAGDSLFFHYSGHGGRVEDDDEGEEKDGYDETVVPIDYKKSGQIRDDDLFSLLVAPLPPLAHLTAIMDCCHSGTILDLPYTIIYKKEGKGKKKKEKEKKKKKEKKRGEESDESDKEREEKEEEEDHEEWIMEKAGGEGEGGGGGMGKNPRFGGGRLMRLGKSLFERVERMKAMARKERALQKSNISFYVIPIIIILLAILYIFDL